MAEITAAAVKELRERTGAGMMDCKKALNEVGGDMEAAIDWLRTKGLAAAAKKAITCTTAPITAQIRKSMMLTEFAAADASGRLKPRMAPR